MTSYAICIFSRVRAFDINRTVFRKCSVTSVEIIAWFVVLFVAEGVAGRPSAELRAKSLPSLHI